MLSTPRDLRRIAVDSQDESLQRRTKAGVDPGFYMSDLHQLN